MTKHFTLDHSLSEKELQNSFIYWAYCILFRAEQPDIISQYSGYYNPRYRLKANHYAHRLDNDQKSKIIELYDEGFFVFKVLSCSFEDFSIALTHRKSFYPNYLEQKAHQSSFYFDKHGTYYRQGPKYVRREGQLEKVLSESEVAKFSWREEKGFDRDYRRQNRSPYGRHKTNAKKNSNRCYRRHTNKLIKKGEYDQFYKTKDRHFFNPWDWD